AGAGAGSPRPRLRRVSRGGVAGAPAAVLEDYGDVAEGFLVLHAVTGEAAWLEAAGSLLAIVLEHFADVGVDGSWTYYDTPDDGTDAALVVVRRPQDPADNAYPSGWSAACGALLSYAGLTGSQRHRAAAEGGLAVAARTGGRVPRAFGWALAVAEALADGPREVAVTGPDADGRRRALHAVALAGTAPGMVISVGEPDADGIPLLEHRPSVRGRPTAYVCRRFVCQAPVTTPEALAEQVGATLPPPAPEPEKAPEAGRDAGPALSPERTGQTSSGAAAASE
ncbi:MAG TPA: hypothetical protein VMT69_02020, partial [Kineosporiaceae bacterium]|nr:hypothetical protein [Kineosporiaceae bacterium]